MRTALVVIEPTYDEILADGYYWDYGGENPDTAIRRFYLIPDGRLYEINTETRTIVNSWSSEQGYLNEVFSKWTN